MLNDAYETSDLGLASYLACLGLNVDRIDRANPRRAVFHFSDANEATEFARQYWNGTARVPPLALLTAQRTLKHRLYNNA